MGKTFIDEGIESTIATFNLFYRSAPDKNNWAVVSGVEEALQMVQGIGSEPESFFEKFLPGDNYHYYRKFLASMKFTGTIYAMEEGEIVFPTQPIIIVRAPLIEAQILETPLLSIMNHQMAVATKASRVSRATQKPISEFGSRRAHGPWAAVYGGKAAFIGGCLNTSNITTGIKFDIPSSGTMAHSFVNAFGCSIESEYRAFVAYIQSHRGEPLTLLVDTYDTLKSGIRNAIKAFKAEGIDDSYPNGYAIRLDSGDLTYLSNHCREALDRAGLKKCQIFATNALDEYLIAELERQNAKIDAYGVGDAIATSKHNPCFGNVYKLVEVGGEAVLKRSEEKSKLINPGFQLSYRIVVNNLFKGDVTTLAGDTMAKDIESGKDIVIRHEWDATKVTKFKGGEYSYKVLQKKVIDGGKLIVEFKPLKERREYYLQNLASFNPTQVRIINPHFYKVNISDDLYNLKSKIINSLIEEIKKINDDEK